MKNAMTNATPQTRLIHLARFSASLAISIVSFFIADYAHSAAAIGQKAPDFTLTDTPAKRCA